MSQQYLQQEILYTIEGSGQCQSHKNLAHFSKQINLVLLLEQPRFIRDQRQRSFPESILPNLFLVKQPFFLFFKIKLDHFILNALFLMLQTLELNKEKNQEIKYQQNLLPGRYLLFPVISQTFCYYVDSLPDLVSVVVEVTVGLLVLVVQRQAADRRIRKSTTPKILAVL